jgi:carboxyl-terminal processing protease
MESYIQDKPSSKNGAARALNAIATLVAVLGAFALGVYIGRPENLQNATPPPGVIGAEIGRPNDVDASILWDVWRRVESKYVDRDSIDRQNLVYGAAEGIVRALGDPYSVFLPPEEAKQFEQDVRGAFEGIGAEIGIRKDVLTVIAPLEGSPAKAAGLAPGDKILKINDESTLDMTVEAAVSRIRGPQGTEVRLTVVHEEGESTAEITIRREVIKIPVLAVETKSIREGASGGGFPATGDKIAVIKLFHFTETLPNEFRRAARQLDSGKTKGIVLDLRNNPGGFLEVAADMSGWFMDSGLIVAVEDFGDGRKEEYRTSGPGTFKDTPLVVLINKGSASAAEILAGALRDQRSIKLVGEQSFGKGSVQDLETLRDGASLKVTVAKWVTPKGTVLEKSGLDPDVKVEQTSEDISAGRDPQLDKALELLRK